MLPLAAGPILASRKRCTLPRSQHRIAPGRRLRRQPVPFRRPLIIHEVRAIPVNPNESAAPTMAAREAQAVRGRPETLATRETPEARADSAVLEAPLALLSKALAGSPINPVGGGSRPACRPNGSPSTFRRRIPRRYRCPSHRFHLYRPSRCRLRYQLRRCRHRRYLIPARCSNCPRLENCGPSCCESRGGNEGLSCRARWSPASWPLGCSIAPLTWRTGGCLAALPPKASFA